MDIGKREGKCSTNYKFLIATLLKRASSLPNNKVLENKWKNLKNNLKKKRHNYIFGIETTKG